MENMVGKVLFPIFAVAHGVMWHTCKFHEHDGMCVQLFGLFWDGNHYEEEEVPTVQNIFARLFSSLTTSHRRRRHNEPDLLLVQQEMLERQQHYRLELVREVNLALAVLCALSISVKSETIRTQMLFVESVIFGLAAYDTSQMKTIGSGDIMAGSLPLMVLLFLLALVGLVIQVRKDPAIKEEFFSEISEGEADVQEDSRVPFEKLPAEVQELMVQSAEEVVVAVAPESPAAVISEEPSSTVTATVIKPHKASAVGISVKKVPNDCRIVIQRLFEDGLLADSPLQVGQTILSINGTPTTEMKSAREVTALIKEAAEVTVVATKSVRVPVVKPTVDARVGVSFSKCKKREGSVTIHSITEESLFAGSSLEAGMRVLAINNQACPSDLKVVGKMVKETDGELVIYAVHDDSSSRMTKAPIRTSAAPSFTIPKRSMSKVEQPPEEAPLPLPAKETKFKGTTKSEF